jgi:hypothetical protein
MHLVKDIKPEIIKDMAEMLDAGMVCFYHKPSGAMDYYPDEDKNPGFDEEQWTDVIEKTEENGDDYIRVEGLDTPESFRIMEDFIAGIDDIPTHNRFIDAISRKKPFRNFSDMLFNYPDLREAWFAYKLERYIAYVKEQLAFEGL